MKREYCLCFVAGLIMAGILSALFAPAVKAFRVYNGNSIEIDPTGCGPFQRWNILRFSDHKIPYKINEKGSNDLSLSDTTSGVMDAFNSWKSIPGLPVDFRFDGYTSTIGYNPQDNINVVFWDETGEILDNFGAGQFTLGYTVTRVDTITAEIINSDIGFRGRSTGTCLPFFSVEIKWSITEEKEVDCFSFVKVSKVQKWGAHEVGHFLGLAHSSFNTALMFATPQVENLSTDDIAGARFLYPSNTDIPPGGDSCPNFFFSVSPFTASISAGNTATYSISLQSVNNFNNPVSFSVLGLPSGVSFTPISASPLPNATVTMALSIEISTSAQPGDYTLLVQGTFGSLSKQQHIGLTIKTGNEQVAPRIDKITPSQVIVGKEDVVLTVDGANFKSKFKGIVRNSRNEKFNLTGSQTKFIRDTQIQVIVTIGRSGDPGDNLTLQICNLDDKLCSDPFPFTAVPAGSERPQITSIMLKHLGPPDSGDRPNVADIIGNDFKRNKVQVFVSGPGCVGSNECFIPNDTLRVYGPVTSTSIGSVPMFFLIPGNYSVYVQNGTADTQSNSFPFTVPFPSTFFIGERVEAIVNNPWELGSDIVVGDTGTVVCVDPNLTEILVDWDKPINKGSTGFGNCENKARPGHGFTVLKKHIKNILDNNRPEISRVIPQSNPMVGVPFLIRIEGRNINTGTVRVLVRGQACPDFNPCVVPNEVLSGKSNTQIDNVPLTINNSGSFQVHIQNGSVGAVSNGIVINIP